jgi:hypothetical protein
MTILMMFIIGMNSEKPFQNYSKQYQSVSHFLNQIAKHRKLVNVVKLFDHNAHWNSIFEFLPKPNYLVVKGFLMNSK